jgi:heat shock protein HslJ
MYAFRVACAAVLSAGFFVVASPALSQDKMKAAPQPTAPAVGGLKAPSKAPARFVCGPKTCTCSGNADCNALFASNTCKSGTSTHDARTSNGQCQTEK